MQRAATAHLVQRERMHIGLFEWLDENSPNRSIAVTLTFDPNRSNANKDRQEAETMFCQFTKIVNRKVFGNAAIRFRKKLTVIPVLEGGGSTGKHYHYHALIEVPHYMSEETFIEVLRQAWGRLPGTGNENRWKECRNSGWLQYMLKDRDKDDLLDALDIGNLWLNTTTSMQRRASFDASSGKQGTPISAPLIATASPEPLPDRA